MKLYATVTSERASKGQGGNKSLAIKIQAGRERGILCEIMVVTHQNDDGSESFIAWCYDKKIAELRDTKGNKQKTL